MGLYFLLVAVASAIAGLLYGLFWTMLRLRAFVAAVPAQLTMIGAVVYTLLEGGDVWAVVLSCFITLLCFWVGCVLSLVLSPIEPKDNERGH